ncbi:MAG: DUF3048 domain-containing protein [Anaerolineae bacterium]|nr:DUF3048 domain-containing protein [Anaerolineae bacterium]
MKRVLIIIFLVMIIFSLVACQSTDQSAAAAETVPTELPPSTATLISPAPTLTPIPTQISPTDTSTPIPPPTVTPTPAPPTPTPHIYIVQAGDTLFDLAQTFDTTVEDLVIANGIRDKNFIRTGQELMIVSSKIAEVAMADTPTPTVAPAPAETAVATKPPSVQARTMTETATAEAAVGENPKPAPSPPTPIVSSGPPPPTVAHPDNINPLTGLPVDNPEVLRHRPLMVRIGNDPGARPQVALNEADVVYEEITEWWVTRFTAIYLGATPDTVAPIRSVRLINVQLVPQYQGALAHSGGSDAVRWEVSQAPIANLDEYYNPTPYFYRPNEGWQTRLAIDAQAARDYMAAKGLDAPVVLQGFFFSDTPEQGEPGENIYIAYPRVTSATEWHYDPASGQYLRWISGQPLYDFNGGQVSADNVIIYFAEHQPTNIVEDVNGATSIRIIMNGRGPAWFFREGKLNKGYWQTDGTRTPYFAYEDGSSYHLKPGRTWVEVAPLTYTIGLNSADEASSK